MNIKKYIQRFIPVLLVSLSSNAFSDKQPADAYTYTESKLAITLTPDHPTFTIKLKSNPTTGFSWFLRQYDAKLVTPIKHDYVAPHSKIIGAGGFEIWQFKATPAAFVVPQQSQIQFVYMRPWEVAGNVTQLVFQVTSH